MRHKTSSTPCRHDIRPVLTQASVGVPQYEEENVKDDGDVIADLIHLCGDPALVCWLGCLKCLPIRLYRIDLTVKFNFSNLHFYLMRSKLRCFSGVWFVHCLCLWNPADLLFSAFLLTEVIHWCECQWQHSTIWTGLSRLKLLVMHRPRWTQVFLHWFFGRNGFEMTPIMYFGLVWNINFGFQKKLLRCITEFYRF